MHCHKCGKEIKRGSIFCKYCGTKQYSVIKKSLHHISKRVKKSERFIVKHVAVIVVVLLMVIIILQILSIVNSESSSTIKSSPSAIKHKEIKHRKSFVL